jgi:NADH:ubiquinone oxidoreductase subunit K
MTDLSLTLHAALVLVALGLGAAVARRSFFVVAMGLSCAATGGVLALVVAGVTRGDPRLIAAALVALLLVAAFAVGCVAVGLAVYRRRGTENLDELTELSG